MISVTAILRIGSEPETRDAAGTPVVSFRGASNTKVKGEEVATWVNVSFFGERAVKVAPYLRKGERVGVAGTLHNREYVVDGQKRYSLELRVNELELLGTKPANDAAGAPKNGTKNVPYDDQF